MLQNLLDITWLKKDDILEQIQDKFDIWLQFANLIRQEFDKETKLFNYEKKNKKKIGDSTLFNVHSAMMAREYIDKPASKFEWTIWQLDIVNNLNTVLDMDFNTAEMENLIYDWKHDKFLRWLWIICRNGWDGTFKRPTYNIVDPRLAILDPDWDYRNGEYSFFGFQKAEYWKLLKKWWFENLDLINKNSSYWDATKLKEQDQMWFKLWNRSKSLDNPLIECYYHFDTFWEWKNETRALVVTTDNNTEIIKVKIYKKNNRVKMFDDILAITYWRPRKNNPFGDRMSRYVWDIQIFKSELANLRFDKSKAELYPMYLRNTRLIKNKAELDFGFNKIIDANPLEWESLANAVIPLQRDVRADNSYLIEDSLDKQIEASTSIWKIAQWASPERREAATTNALIQSNTDINLAFTWKIDAIWYEKLLITWKEWYLDEFRWWDTKLIYIQTWFWMLSRDLEKADFLTDIALKIKIETLIEINEKKQKDRIIYWQAIWLLQWLPNRGESAINSTYRLYLKSLDMSPEEIEMQIPTTIQEDIARENVGRLLKWEFVPIESDYDVNTHLIALKSIWDTPMTRLYKRQLFDLKKAQQEVGIWIPQEQSQDMTWIKNNLLAQSMSMVWNEALQK